MSLKRRLQDWAVSLKRHLTAIYYVYRDPQTPCLTRWLALLLVAYAVSPIDLIPDFIPLIGYLDELILLPLGCWFVIHSISKAIWQRSLQKAEGHTTLPRFLWMSLLIILLWLMLILAVLFLSFM
jgi:uncharacterized membrane protein YkvA (DUF1232 family)